jgi:hypothetical protein
MAIRALLFLEQLPPGPDPVGVVQIVRFFGGGSSQGQPGRDDQNHAGS